MNRLELIKQALVLQKVFRDPMNVAIIVMKLADTALHEVRGLCSCLPPPPHHKWQLLIPSLPRFNISLCNHLRSKQPGVLLSEKVEVPSTLYSDWLSPSWNGDQVRENTIKSYGNHYIKKYKEEVFFGTKKRLWPTYLHYYGTDSGSC